MLVLRKLLVLVLEFILCGIRDLYMFERFISLGGLSKVFQNESVSMAACCCKVSPAIEEGVFVSSGNKIFLRQA